MPGIHFPPDVLSVAGACKLMGLSPYRVLKEAAAGRITVVNLPGYPIGLDKKSVEQRAREMDCRTPPAPTPARRRTRPHVPAGK